MGEQKKLEDVFTTVYQKNIWGEDTSCSGPGSSMEQTVAIREWISELIRRYNIKSIVDAPCGDFFWMKEVVKSEINYIDSYTGIDIVDDLIAHNNRKYKSDKVNFIRSDLTCNLVPKADLIFCRDCFLHLSFRNIYKIINNFKLSGSTYLLVSTYDRHDNKNVFRFSVAGRPINLEKAPFKLIARLDLMNENYRGQQKEYNDKSLMFIRLNLVDTKQINHIILLNEIFFIPGFLVIDLFRKVFHRAIRVIKKS